MLDRIILKERMGAGAMDFCMHIDKIRKISRHLINDKAGQEKPGLSIDDHTHDHPWLDSCSIY
jgi:hypothetical protein